MTTGRRNWRSYGFTLIELLIVIAIILILIAIALPNFLEAQERARVTRANAQLRTLETAIFSHIMDYGFVYADFNDSFLVTTVTRNKQRFKIDPCGTQAPPFYHTSTLDFSKVGAPLYFYSPNIHCPLTTPIRYLDPLDVTDPWGDGSVPVGMDSREIASNDIPGRSLSPENGSTIVYAAYFISGPDRSEGEWQRGCEIWNGRGIGCAYSPTNGTKAKGDIWMVISTVDNDFAKNEYVPLRTF
ncbi:MAG: prepilin-type N-terminal cleavage/methylation domain-containing protein [Candidatus Omnitrophica bacterium]|nr:prepilin-type N-terminal cleavage/methylation domain-containing protein [Candidatus Omnitrophota bacterium]